MTTDKKIKVIKHFVDRTEGFELHHGPERLDCYDSKFVHWVRMPDDDVMVFLEAESDDDKEFMWKVLWPLFLQRAIEGVNRESYYGDKNQREIVIRRWGVEICSYLTEDHSVRYFRFEADSGYTVDDAKLAALEWIMEKEKEV